MTSNDSQQTTENKIIEQESEEITIPKRARILRNKPSFESSISNENFSVTRFKEVKIIRFFKKVTTYVFKETINAEDDSVISSIESSKKHKELIKEASENRIITYEEANQSRMQPSIQTASNEFELINAIKYQNSKKESFVRPSRISTRKSTSLSLNRKRTREPSATPKIKNNKKKRRNNYSKRFKQLKKFNIYSKSNPLYVKTKENN